MGWLVNTMLLPLYRRELDSVPILLEAGWTPGWCGQV